MSSTTTAYYDRQANTIEGLFTVRTVEDGRIIKELRQLKARSGQRGSENTSWVRGKSPIPFGEHYLWIDKPLQAWQSAGQSGIGHFLNISSGLDNRRLILGPNGEMRDLIGLHPENKWIGSAGCIVLIETAQMWDMFKYIDSLKDKQKWLRLIVL
jgi:hypothetical protein